MTTGSLKLLPLHALFVEGRPDDAPVCHDGERFICWREFAGRVGGLAAELRQRPETCWLLAGDDPLEFVARLFALLHAGKQVIIPPNTQPGTLAALAGIFEARIDAFDALTPCCDAPDRLPAIDPHAAIIDLYTSGSTGEHKRVRKTFAQFEAEVAVLEALWGGKLGASAVIATAPHQHIYGLLFRLLWPLGSGRVFDAVMCAHPDALEERLAFFSKAAVISSPAQLARLPELLPLAELDPKPVAVFSSGGPLPAGAARELAAGLGEAPIEVFGSTETGGVAWRQQNGADGDLWSPFPCHMVSCSALGALTLRSPFLSDTAPWEMDDGIELLPDGRFRLLGRLDRVVKIEEKRLSLPQMEARLYAHPWVEAAALVPLSGRRQCVGAVLVLGLEGRERLRIEGRRAVTQALRKHLAGDFDAVLLPRHWRFPDRLPTDERGKLPVATLSALFAGDGGVLGVLYPQVLQIEGDGTHRAELDLLMTPEIAHFAGHFPGAAILPGVVQVDWAIHFARLHLPLYGEFSALENLKFLAVVQPGETLRLSLAWNADQGRLDFSYATPERKCSAGRVVFGGAQ